MNREMKGKKVKNIIAIKEATYATSKKSLKNFRLSFRN